MGWGLLQYTVARKCDVSQLPCDVDKWLGGMGRCRVQGSQIRQIWRILRQNCSNDSTEVTEGVTSTPEIFGNKHSFVLTFFATNTITLR